MRNTARVDSSHTRSVPQSTQEVVLRGNHTASPTWWRGSKRALRQLLLALTCSFTVLLTVSAAYGAPVDISNQGDASVMSTPSSLYVSASAQSVQPDGTGPSISEVHRTACRKRQKPLPDAFTPCQYYGAYYGALNHPKKVVRAHLRGLAKPGRAHAEDREKLFKRLRPAAYYEFQITHMAPKEAARLIWSKEFGWSEGQIQAGYEIIAGENAAWDPWLYNRGGSGACGIPQFIPCRHLGDAVAQIRAFVHYVEHEHYHSVWEALDHKRRFGWY